MKRHANGFTLIELLVVISIIALLVAILMPALGNARMQATAAVCLSNMKTMSMALFLYADDNNALMPQSDVWGGFKWAFVHPPVAATTESEKMGIKNGTLWKYTQTTECYNCPGDKRTAWNGGGTGYRTYSLVGGINGVPWSGRFTRSVKKFNEIPRPSEKYTFVEEQQYIKDGNRGNDWNYGCWVTGVATYSMVDSVAVWHNKGSTFGFADGHAELRKWHDDRTVKFCEAGLNGQNQTWGHNPPNEDLNWLIMHWPTNEKRPAYKFPGS